MSHGSPLTRLAPIAAPVLMVLALAVGTLVGVVRYTPFLDPRSGAMPTDEHHRDPKPCLRYPTAPPPAEIHAAAKALVAAGVTHATTTDLIGDFYARAATREAGLHALSPVDEHLEVMARGGTLSWLAVALKGERLRAQLATVLGPLPPVSSTIAALPPGQRAAIEAQWAKEPSVFVLPGLIDLVNELKRLVTEQRLDALLARLEAQRAAGQTPTLDGLEAEAGREALEDAWFFAFTLERTAPDQLTLMSLGADRALGGTGLDADLTRTLTIEPSAAEPPDAPLACEGKTELELPRADLDEALRDLAEVAKQARFVPSMTNGVFAGFKVLRLERGLFTRAGLCEGDVVLTLNGVPLGSPDQALEAYSALKDAKRVEVALSRGGKPVTLVVTLR